MTVNEPGAMDAVVEDATLRPGVRVTPVRSSGTVCVRREHYLPEFTVVPPPEPASRGDPKWEKFAASLASEAARSKSRLVLLGDSITERWRGTSQGKKIKGGSGRGPEALAREFGEYDPLVLAISGDTTANLLWRLHNGGFPEATPPEYVAVMIGTNDIGSVVQRKTNGGWSDGACVSDENLEEAMGAIPSTVAGIKDVVATVRRLAPRAKIVVLGLLPRGEQHGKLWTKKYSMKQPSVYTASTDEVNKRVEEHVASLADPRVRFAPCKLPWIERDGGGGHFRIRKDLMKDALHENMEADAFAVLAGCVKGGMARVDAAAEEKDIGPMVDVASVPANTEGGSAGEKNAAVEDAGRTDASGNAAV